jgi:hypothetical protein
VLAARGINADNPQFAEFTLLDAPVAVGEDACPIGCLLGIPVEPAGVSKISLCLAECPLTTLTGCGGVLCFRHVRLFLV